MSSHRLVPHPAAPHPDIGITVALARVSARSLNIRYALTGDVERVMMPPLASSQRADELWRHSCFELFLRAGDAVDYREFNISPSTRWAAYHLSRYRHGMTNLPIAAPRIALERNRAAQVLTAAIDLDADMPIDRPWRLGPAAVVEDRRGALSYWAPAHPPGMPDFHHPDCFAIELPSPPPA